MLRNSNRILPRLKSLFSKKSTNAIRIQTPLVGCRGFHQKRSDPFSQMESFMKDMEKKFWNEVNYNFPRIPTFSRFGNLPESSVDLQPKYGSFGPSNLSTSDKFKMGFNFPQAKPEDIKVTLKDKLLTIEAKIEETSETSKMNQSFSFQYTIPNSVDVELLESHLSNDGTLTIEAPKTPDEAPKTININRE